MGGSYYLLLEEGKAKPTRPRLSIEKELDLDLEQTDSTDVVKQVNHSRFAFD
jgi:hypothetical protein